MLFKSRAERIAQQADAWVVRLGGTLTAQESAEFQAWRRADPRHETALQRAQHVWGASEGMPRAYQAPAQRSRSLQPRLAFASFAAVLAVVGGTILLKHSLSPVVPASTEMASGSAARTVRLVDGSEVRLAADSAIRTHFDGTLRGVLLERGEARFNVAHDPAHPFVVTAGNRHVTAVGTVFDVALQPSGMSVTMIQGVVEVARAHAQSESIRPIRLTKGQRLVVSGERQTVTAVAASPIARSDTARDYDATPLSQVLQDANASAAKPILLADVSLGARKVEGRFDLSDTPALAQQLAAALGLRLIEQPGRYVLSPIG
ncbi:MAG TPA: FecR domain-containing protein [Sphingomonas sp.]|nr:FecR domain-containing protein [Sphingomonas sp.]